MESRSQRFEALLDRTRGALDRARHYHRSIEGEVGDEFVAALQGIETRLEDLEDVGRIDDTDFEAAETIHRRAGVLEDLLRSLGEFDADVVEHEVQRLRIWTDALTNLAGERAGHDLRSAVSEAESSVGLFETLIESGKHARVRSNDQFTPSDVDCDLRELDRRLRDATSEAAYVDACLGGLETFVDRIHEPLADLRETNPDRTAFADQLQAVKDERDRVQAERDADAARTALEGAMMVYDSVTRAVCRQAHADRLADAIREHDIPSAEDPYELAERVDLEALLDVIATGIDDVSEQTRTSRFERLLAEHDGSVRRTLSATEYEPTDAFERLRDLYEDETIEDLTVTFDR